MEIPISSSTLLYVLSIVLGDRMTKKTICIFTTFYLPNLGGVEKYTANIARALAEDHHCRVIIVTSSLDGKTGITKQADITIVHIPSRLFLNDRFAMPKSGNELDEIVHWLNQQPIDYILINQRFYFTSIFAMEYARKRHIVPLVLDHGSAHLTVANPFLDFFIQKYEHLITRYGKRFDNRYIAVSSTSAKWLEHFGIDAIGVVNNSIDAESFIKTSSNRDFRSELHIDPDAFIVVFTGRLMKEKGLIPLCNAIESFNESHLADVHLVIAGLGPLEDYLRSLNDDHIHLVGRLSAEDIASLLTQGDVFCLPTVSEGFSTSMLEAAAAGMGIAITNTGGVKELIPNEDFGIILESDDPTTISDAILRFYRDEAYLGKCSHNVSERVKENFNWNKAARDLLDIFSQINTSSYQNQ